MLFLIDDNHTIPSVYPRVLQATLASLLKFNKISFIIYVNVFFKIIELCSRMTTLISIKAHEVFQKKYYG